MTAGGGGNSPLAERVIKRKLQLAGASEKYIKECGNRKEALRIAKNKAKSRLDFIRIDSGIDYTIFDEFIRVMKRVNIFIWCSKLQILDIMKYFLDGKDKKKILFELLTWNKTNPTPTTNNIWLPDIEYCLYFRESGVKLNNNYEFKSKWFTSLANKKDKDLFSHPTIKPLELVKRHLLHTTKPNDIVLDCFAGSGTTCVACQEIGRRFIGMEIEPHWCKIANDRLNKIDAGGQIGMFLR